MCILEAIIIGVIGTLVGIITGISVEKYKQKSINHVHFYVTCEKNYRGEILHTLWIGEPYYTEDKGFMSDAWSSILAVNESFVLYNLNHFDFEDMKEGEMREVFIQMDN